MPDKYTILPFLAYLAIIITLFNPCLFERDSVEFAELTQRWANERVFTYAHSPGYPILIHSYTGFYLIVRDFLDIEATLALTHAIYGLATLLLFFCFYKRSIGNEKAKNALFFLSLCPLFLASVFIIQSDITSLFFMALALLLSELSAPLLASFALSLSIGVRIANALMTPYFILKYRKDRREAILLLAVPIILTLFFYDLWGAGFNLVFGAKDYARSKPEYFMLSLPSTYDYFSGSLTPPGLLLAGIGLVTLVIKKEKERLLLLGSWFLPMFLYYSGLAVYRDKYILPLIPVLIILSAEAVSFISSSIRSKWISNIAVLSVSLWMLFSFAGVYVPRQQTCPAKEFATSLRSVVADSAVISCDYDMALRHYANITTIGFDLANVRSILLSGKSVYTTVEGLVCVKNQLESLMQEFNFDIIATFTNENYHDAFLVRRLYNEQVYEVSLR
jgi:hypothetical protein